MNAWLECHQCHVFDVFSFITGALTVYLYCLACDRLPGLVARFRRGPVIQLEQSER